MKEHKHDFTVYDLMQTYAVCNKCGYHDWGEYDGDGERITDFRKKYPDARVVGFDDEA